MSDGRSNPEQSDQPRAVIALDLGGTKLAAALFTGEGRPLAKRTVPLECRDGEEVGTLIAKEVRRLAKAGLENEMAVCAVSAAVPGIAHPQSGHVWAPNISGWDDYPLRAEISATVADPAVKVIVESDRAASILGEVWQGAARGCRDAVFLAVGTGIGAGILVDGRVLHGAHGIAGAVGWLALDRPFKAEYVQGGCFELHASGEGLAKVARATLTRRRTDRGLLRADGDLTAHDVFRAFEQGDAAAKEVVAQAIEFWGMASANLVSLLNPEKIIFGGGVFGPATRLLDAIAAEARRWAQPIAIERVKFEPSQLGGDAALYGAGWLALRRARSTK